MTTASLDSRQIRAACQEALAEVLETMFFELPVDEPAGLAPPAEATTVVARFLGQIGDGIFEGRFRVAIDEPMLYRLTQDFLGLDELEMPEASQTLSVHRELANMLCGSTLSRLSPEAHLRIAPPEALPPGSAEPVPGPGVRTSPWIDTPLECGRLWVKVEVWEAA